MELTKAQKATLAMVKEDIERLVNSVGKSSGPMSFDRFYDANYAIGELKRIEASIVEYGLEKKLITDAIEAVYNVFMKKKLYSHAASFAKEYGL